MTYTLYIAENCHQCAEVVNFMKESKVDYNTINVDSTSIAPPIKLFAFPALFKGETLICYGIDIKRFVNKELS